jgi:hypothetical protein
LQEGRIEVGGRIVTVEEVSRARPQRFAFVTDTRLCEAVYALAEGVDPPASWTGSAGDVDNAVSALEELLSHRRTGSSASITRTHSNPSVSAIM